MRDDDLLNNIEMCAHMALRAVCTGFHDSGLPRMLWNLARLEAHAEAEGLLHDGGIDGFYLARLPRFDRLVQTPDYQEFLFYVGVQSWAEGWRQELGLAPYDGAESRDRLAYDYYRDVLRAMESDWHRGHFNATEAEMMEERAGLARERFVVCFGEDAADREETRIAAEDYPPCDDKATLDRITYRGGRTAWQLIALLSCPPE